MHNVPLFLSSLGSQISQSYLHLHTGERPGNEASTLGLFPAQCTVYIYSLVTRLSDTHTSCRVFFSEMVSVQDWDYTQQENGGTSNNIGLT